MQELFVTNLLKWYDKNKRDLPWRHTQNPYKIWLSEIILQQTRVEQGLSYYVAFLDKYPSVFALAKASEQEVLKLWQGLGYYSRARNLHFTARYIVENLKGEFPKSYTELLKLKGVGKYTAAAIASFAYGEVVPAIDGNAYRVLSRVFGEYELINTPKAEKRFRELSEEILPEKFVGEYNQAIMELGAVVCKPKTPNCPICPIEAVCWAMENKKQHELPVKKIASKVRKRYFNYFVIEENENLVLQERLEKDVWQHLFQFPLLEQENPSLKDITLFLQEYFKLSCEIILHQENTETIIHKLSHQHLYITFWSVKMSITFLPPKYIMVKKENLDSYPFPIVIANFIKDF